MTKVHSTDMRWSWMEVDLGALRANARAFKELLGPHVKLMAVVKADAYGHGAVECVKALHAAGAEQFAVSTIEEGIELREAGIPWPILVLSEPPDESVSELVRYDIMPSIYTVEFALAYGECAAAAGKVGRYHLAIDTGMTRIGIDYSEAVEFRSAIDFHRGLECAGTFTHFATANALESWDFELQYKRFIDAINALDEAGFDCGIVHCDNTVATILHRDTHIDMCRVGIGLYGLHPDELTKRYIKLEPVMSVRARITRTAFPAIGTGVGYGLTYRVPRAGIQIATVPMGYADGLARSLSGEMDVIVKGRRCHQVGAICMDQFMFAIDTTNPRADRRMAPAQQGDLVTIIGRDGDEVITVDEMAQLRGTINYEIVCNFGARLDKVYV